MDVIEKAIRRAFEKGDAEDRAFREKVYRQAFAALDRALQANPSATVENAIARRKALQATIVEIESEFIVAVPAAPEVRSDRADPDRSGAPTRPGVAPAVDAPGMDVQGMGAPGTGSPGAEAPRSAAPAVSLDAVSGPAVPQPEVTLDAPAPGDGSAPSVSLDSAVPRQSGGAAPSPAAEVVAGGYDPRARQRRGSFRTVLTVFLLLVVLAGAAWLAVRQGWLQLPSGRNTGEVRTEAPEESEEFTPEAPGAPPPLGPAESGPEREWVTVFDPGDPTLVTAPSDATAEMMQDETGSFLRIRSGASGSAVAFDVGQGVLEGLAGKTAVFDVVARAADGGQTEISVECSFGELGDCGRRRYAVGYERGEFLFEITLPDVAPGAGGTIAINSDFAGEGRAVDIYEIRVAAQ